MREVNIIGVGVTPFGKFADQNMKSMSQAAVALADAGKNHDDIDLLVHGNSLDGALQRQHCIRGQVALGETGFHRQAVVDVENACASSSTAMHVALMGIRSGMYDTAVVGGSEKLSGSSTREALDGMLSGTDLERVPVIAKELTGSDDPPESFYMSMYSWVTQKYMEQSGATRDDFADVAVTNSGATGCAQLLELVTQLRGRAAAVRSRVRVSRWPKTRAVTSTPILPFARTRS